MDRLNRIRLVLLRTVRPGVNLAAHLILAAALVVQSLLYSSGALNVEETIGANWRGAYDILVLPEGAKLPQLEDRQGRQLIDPNFANVDLGANISWDVLDQIRQRKDLEVVAPIGFLARLANTMEWPVVSVPLAQFADDPIQAFRLDSTVTTDSGLGEQISQSYSNWIIIDTREWDGKEPFANTPQSIKLAAAYDTQFVAENGYLKFSQWPLPVVSSTIFAVDPIEEEKLLGDSGSFLKPLQEFDEVTAAHPRLDWSTFSKDLPTDPSLEKIQPFLDKPTNELVRYDKYGVGSPLAPFVRNVNAYPPMDLTVDFSRISGTPLRATPTEIQRIYQLPTESVGRTTIDVRDLERPFSHSVLDVLWPGEAEGLPNLVVHPDAPTTISALALTPMALDSNSPLVSVRAEPQGFVRPIPNDKVTGGQRDADGHGLGQTQTYRSSDLARNSFSVGSTNKHGAAPVEVGEYSPQQIAGQLEKSDYAPLGAYDPAPVRIMNHTLTPTLHGLGIAAQASSAITSLAGAQTLGVKDPVSAIRIRVSGIEKYSPDSVRRVQQIAGEISQLGVKTYVVAGSSQQDVEIFVPDYAFGQIDPNKTQAVGDLGWVTTPFTTVGAAVTSQAALLGLNATLGDLGIGVSLLALALTSAMGIRSARQETAALRISGFTSSQTRGWWAQEGTVPLAITTVAAIFSVVLSGYSHRALLRSFAVVAIVLVLNLLTNHLATRAEKAPRGGSRSADSFAVLNSNTGVLGRKMVMWHAPWLALRCVSLAVSATAIGIASGASRWTQTTISTTALGTQLADASGWLRLVMIGLAALVGIVVFALATNVESASRKGFVELLRGPLSWTSAQRLVIPRLESLVVASAAGMVGIGGSAVLAQLLNFNVLLCAGTAALVITVSVAVTHHRAVQAWK